MHLSARGRTRLSLKTATQNTAFTATTAAKKRAGRLGDLLPVALLGAFLLPAAKFMANQMTERRI